MFLRSCLILFIYALLAISISSAFAMDKQMDSAASQNSNKITSAKDTNTSNTHASLGAGSQLSSENLEKNGLDIVNTKPMRDPFEKFNRAMFVFNDKIDILILKPLATFYNLIIPKPLNKGIHNAYNNIRTLVTIANDVLQLHFTQTLNDLWRLSINTTIGIGGLFDVAELFQLTPYTNDFGLTLARWGWQDSNYIVLPFFGPNTLRDAIDIPVDYLAFSIYPRIYPYSTRYLIYGFGVVERRAQLLKFESIFTEAALDKYIFLRSAFMQRRSYQIQQNKALGFSGRVTGEEF